MIAAIPAAQPATTPVPTPEPGFNLPKVWKRGQVGIGLGTGFSPLAFGERHVATEFGRGRLGLGTTQGYDLYYESPVDAIRAAAYLSAGQQGAITLDHANFIGNELRTVDVLEDGSSQVPNARPVPYHFEELADTVRGRRELEKTLKFDGIQYLVDGRFMAIGERDGNVKIVNTFEWLQAQDTARTKRG
jgi:hypothetical protein